LAGCEQFDQARISAPKGSFPLACCRYPSFKRAQGVPMDCAGKAAGLLPAANGAALRLHSGGGTRLPPPQ